MEGWGRGMELMMTEGKPIHQQRPATVNEMATTRKELTELNTQPMSQRRPPAMDSSMR
jgi:hypothetical protein